MAMRYLPAQAIVTRCLAMMCDGNMAVHRRIDVHGLDSLHR